MEALKELLAKVVASNGYLSPASNQEQDMNNFQATVYALECAWEKGLLENFKPHKESQSGHGWIDNVYVGKLTAEGEALLQDQIIAKNAP